MKTIDFDKKNQNIGTAGDSWSMEGHTFIENASK